MNNVSFYFRSTITTKDFAMKTLDKLYDSATEKYVVCCKDFKRFHLSQYGGKSVKANQFLVQIDLVLAQTIYVVIRSFFKYLVCNIRGGPGIFMKEDYHDFFTYSLKFFTDGFDKYKGEFSSLHKILEAKTLKLAVEE